MHFLNEIVHLKKQLLTLSAYVEESLRNASRALHERDTALAGAVIDADERIDNMEIEVEEDCLKVLALYHPVAGDLRFIVSALKMNNELERIGDLAKNIAERAQQTASQPPLPVPAALGEIGEKATMMVKMSLDALVNLSAELAEQVCRLDDEVDELNRGMFDTVRAAIARQPDRVDTLIHYLSVSRSFERVADHATNIAEDVIYMIRGEIIRHRK
jgi:phosphate transport system protein